jgi:beta-lactamase regulating signal transducer with metallopeptidase domain
LPLLPLIADAGGPEATSAGAGAVQLPPLVLPRAPWWLGATVASIWATWATLSLGQAAAGFVRLRRALRNGVPLPIDRENRLRHWPAIRRTGRRVRLIASSDVHVAAVLGPGAPTIAVAPDALDALDDEALDHVLLHEWAHVQRYDDVTRLCQVVVRAVAGLHPAIWWIGRRMDIEREVACDDGVVQITGGAKRYAACLTQVAAAASGRQTVIFAPGALGHSQLRERVSRLLDGRRNASTTRSTASLAAIIPTLAVIALGTANTELVGTAPAIARALEAPERAVTTALSTATRAAEAAADVTRPDPATHTYVPALTGPAPASPKRGDGSRRTERTPASTPEPTEAPRHQVSGAISQPVSRTAAPVPLSSHAVRSAVPAFAPSPPAAAPRDVRAATDVPAPASPAPWDAAARAGVTVGRGSQKAAVATAGFFSNAARRLAGSF